MIDGYETVAVDSLPPVLVILFCNRRLVGTILQYCFGFYDVLKLYSSSLKSSKEFEDQAEMK